MSTITLHRPAFEELTFRQEFLRDPATMSYNHAYGGIVPFPRERWADWYGRWVEDGTGRHFSRYLRDDALGVFVGEAAYHFDEDACFCDIIVPAAYRGRGYGSQGLALLCEAARANGVARLWDDIAIDNPAVRLFLRSGFREVERTKAYILVAKDL